MSSTLRRARTGTIRTLTCLATLCAALGGVALHSPAAHAGPPPPPPVITFDGCHITGSGAGYDQLTLTVTDDHGSVLAWQQGAVSSLTVTYGEYVSAVGASLRVYVNTMIGGSFGPAAQADVVPNCTPGGTLTITRQLLGVPPAVSDVEASIGTAPWPSDCKDDSKVDWIGAASVENGPATIPVPLGQQLCLAPYAFDHTVIHSVTPSTPLPTAAVPHVDATYLTDYRGAHIEPTLEFRKDGKVITGAEAGFPDHGVELHFHSQDDKGNPLQDGFCGIEFPSLECGQIGLAAGGRLVVDQLVTPTGFSLVKTSFDASACAGVPDGGTCPLELVAEATTPVTPPPTTVPPTTAPPTTVVHRPPTTTVPSVTRPVSKTLGDATTTTVVDPNAPVTTLPQTGVDTFWLAYLAARFLLVGFVLLGLRRWLERREARQRQATAASLATTRSTPITNPTITKEHDR